MENPLDSSVSTMEDVDTLYSLAALKSFVGPWLISKIRFRKDCKKKEKNSN